MITPTGIDRKHYEFCVLNELKGLENQSYRASGLILLTAAISLWNTVYIERAIDALMRKEMPINEQLIAYLPRWDGSTSI